MPPGGPAWRPVTQRDDLAPPCHDIEPLGLGGQDPPGESVDVQQVGQQRAETLGVVEQRILDASRLRDTRSIMRVLMSNAP